MTIKNREFLKPFRKYWFKILLAFLLAAIATTASFISVKVLALFVETLSGEKSLNTLLRLILSWLFTELTGYLCNYVASVWISKIKSEIRFEIQMSFFRQISKSTIQSINAFTPNDLGARLQEDPGRVVDAVFNILKEILNILLGLISLAYIWTISSEIFMLFIFSLIIILLTQAMTRKRMEAGFDLSRTTSVNLRMVSEEIFRSFSSIVVQHLEPGIKLPLSRTIHNSKNAELNVDLIVHKNRLITSLHSLASLAALITVSTVLITDSKLSYVDFLEVYMYKGNIYNLATISLQILKELSLYKSSATRLNGLSQALSPRTYGKIRPDTLYGTITVDGLTACVGENDQTILDKITFSIQDGDFVGIVGPSGCGKSTLLRCLAYAQAHTGKICISGVPADKLTKGSWQRLMCFAQQTPHWFNFLSVRENLTLHCPGVNDAKIWHALKKACISDFINKKGGLDVTISQSEMSGGQLQRLALAIVVLSESKIILLDESTSALDGESQSNIVQAIRETTRRKKHTVVFIAHRISALKDADRIIVMDKGQIVDIGNYPELMERCELFRHLAQNA